MTTPIEEAYILVVEDDQNAQMIALDLLRIGGANRCYARKSVAAAITFAEKLPQVDLFLVDINMPDQSGYDLLRIVREHEQLQTAKVVAITAGTLSSDVRKAQEAGFDGFIGKPLKAYKFAAQINNILAGEHVWDSR